MLVESVSGWVLQHVGEAGGVDVSKAGQAAEEVGGVVVCTEQATEVRIEDRFGG